MDKEYIQNLRYKLQKRVRRINSSDCKVFHFVLKQFWGFLNNQQLFIGIMDELETKSALVKDDVEKLFSSRATVVFDSEEENASASYLVIKKCVESQNNNIEIQIAHNYSNESKHNEALEAFKDIFIEPFYEYLDEKLDDSGVILALLRKYKHKCEWFQRENLYESWFKNTQRGEKLLALHLYEYLQDQGVEFSIEPTSASGEVDLVSAQTTKEPLIADAKIFNPEKSKNKEYIAKGFRQIYTYTLDFNEPIGFLVIFKTCEEDLKLTFANQAQMTPFVQHNNKTIFFLVIDIFPYDKSASKRGKLEYIELNEDDLWRNVENKEKNMASNLENGK
ncbi:MAG: hypothetical protein KAR05_06645 [Candidatus Omnitrophica bacterium]|nr:hypothetical protein [Candidatus Omnitrophota bacterium]